MPANGQAAPAGQPTYEQLQEMVKLLQEQAAAKPKVGEITIKIQDGMVKGKDGKEVQGKGTVCVYGLGRFPVPLYAAQWERLLTPANVEKILKTCKDPRAARKAQE